MTTLYAVWLGIFYFPLFAFSLSPHDLEMSNFQPLMTCSIHLFPLSQAAKCRNHATSFSHPRPPCAPTSLLVAVPLELPISSIQRLNISIFLRMSELEDFEAFLEDGFDLVRFAASLLQATNVVDDTELDLATPLKKLQFDANECNKRMETLALTHHSELLRNVDRVLEKKQLLDEVVVPLAERLNMAYERIENDVIRPYEDAVRINEALVKIHQTSSLLRGASFFLLFLQQLAECEKQLLLADDNKDVIRLARTYSQISPFFSKGELPLKDPDVDLLSLRLIREYSPQYEEKSGQFIADLTLKITNDVGHHSSFNSKNTALQNNLLALYAMKKLEFTSVIDSSAMGKSIQVALAPLTRSLQSPRSLAAAFSEVKQSSSNFSATLSSLLTSCEIARIDGDAESGTLLDAYLLSLPKEDGLSVTEAYWSRLAFKFKKSVTATMARGGPVARNLRSQYTLLVDAADAALDGHSAELVKNALSIIGGQQ